MAFKSAAPPEPSLGINGGGFAEGGEGGREVMDALISFAWLLS